jgi:hypothetical protein
MTDFFDEVEYLRTCSNHASEMRLLRSPLASCDGAVRLPYSFSESCVAGIRLRGLDREFLSRRSRRTSLAVWSFVGHRHAAGAPKISVWKLRRDIRDRGGFATSSFAQKVIPDFTERCQSVREPSRAWLRGAKGSGGSILSLIETAKRTASKVAALVLKPNASCSTAKRDFVSGEHSTWN